MVAVNFESWLIGFIEGEGSFCSNRKVYPAFSLAQMDSEILERVKKYFGTGIVNYQPSNHAWQYSAYGKGCWPIRNLCEGKLQMQKKIEQFERWKMLRWPPQHSAILTGAPEQQVTRKVVRSIFYGVSADGTRVPLEVKM